MSNFDSEISSTRKKSSIYTRTGDKGTSSLYNGERRSKDDLVFHALGNSDEMNAALGVAREYCAVAGNGLESMLEEIQCRLFDVGAAIATPANSSSEKKLSYTKFEVSNIDELEEWIDRLDAELPPLTNFVIPSGGISATHLNLSRTVCRRLERSVIPLAAEGYVDAELARYLNRLSDFLFVCVRIAAKREGREEILWRKKKEGKKGGEDSSSSSSNSEG